MIKSKTFEWLKRFIKGRKATSDDSYALQPSTSRNMKKSQKLEILFDQIDE